MMLIPSRTASTWNGMSKRYSGASRLSKAASLNRAHVQFHLTCGQSHLHALAADKLVIFINRSIVIPKSYRWRCGMQTVTVSPKYQVVIPKEIRDALRLRPGQKMRVIEYAGRIAVSYTHLTLPTNRE